MTNELMFMSALITIVFAAFFVVVVIFLLTSALIIRVLDFITVRIFNFSILLWIEHKIFNDEK